MSNYFLKVDKALFGSGLNPLEILLVSQIAEFQTNTGDCFISDKTLADNFGVSESTVKRELKKLEELGYITRETKNIKGGRERHMVINKDKLTSVKLSLDDSNKAQNEPCTKLKMSLDKGQNDTIKDNINNIKEKDNNGVVFQPMAESTTLPMDKEGTITQPIVVKKEYIREQYRKAPQEWVSYCAMGVVLHKPSGKYFRGV